MSREEAWPGPSNEWTGRIRVTHKAVFAGKGPRHGAKGRPPPGRTRQYVGVELSFLGTKMSGSGVVLSGKCPLGAGQTEAARGSGTGHCRR